MENGLNASSPANALNKRQRGTLADISRQAVFGVTLLHCRVA